MQIPARISRLAQIKAVAVKPEAVAVGILYAEIITRRLWRQMPPPFHRDTLRPFHQHDIVLNTPPAETARRTGGNGSDGFDFLRLGEKTKRATRSFRRAAHARP